MTAAGVKFAARGRKALSQIGYARAEVKAIGRGDEGHLKIGIFSSLASGFLRELISEFRKHHTSVCIAFVDGNPADHVAAVRRSQLDVAFITGTTDWAGCQSEHLWSERIFAVLPEDHPQARCDEVSFASLAEETFVVSECAPGEEIRDYLVQRLAGLGHHPDIQQQAVGRDNLMLLVALGQGLTVTSEATTGAQFPKVVYRPIVDETLPFSAVWSPKNESPAFLRLLSLARLMSSSADKREVSVQHPYGSPHAALSRSRDPSP